MQTMLVKINGSERTVNFKEVYTRKIDREFNDILFKNTNASILEQGKDIQLNPTDIQKAQDFLISAMSDLTPEEVDMLAMEDYQKILGLVGKIKNPPKSAQAS